MTVADAIRARGNGIRITAVAVYFVTSGWGVLRLACEPSLQVKVAYVAQRDLPAGRRLRPGDIKINAAIPARLRVLLAGEPPPEGRYLLDARKKMETIGVDQLSDTPHPRIGNGNLQLPFAIASDLVAAGIIDVDSNVALCGAKCDLEVFRVAAVLCSPGATTCTAILDVTREQAAAIANHATSDLRLVAQSISTAPATPGVLATELAK
jgi:hypothetical protein